MHLSQSEHAERFQCGHALFHDLADGRTLLMLSGVVVLDLQAPGWSNEAVQTPPYQLTIALELLLPQGFLAEGQRFSVEQALPYAGLGSLSGSTNVLWGIRRFDVDSAQPLDGTVTLRVEAEVARSSEVLRTIGYTLTLLGRRH